jgi:L-ribulokinase
MYTIGVDFGTESGRALLVDASDGREIATAIHGYEHGVIDERLPNTTRLPPDWALQDPADYVAVVRTTIPALLKETGVAPTEIKGIGIDFTSCTMLPTLNDGTPLCQLPEWRGRPHAWVKLWKHHAAQPQADKINAIARERNEPWLARYGGKYSAEWFFSKALQILEEDPAVYAASERLIEAADWIIWQLTGVESRNRCTAGYKALYQDGHFPSQDFFAALHPDFANVVQTRMCEELVDLGAAAGGLSPQASEWTGLPVGTPVAVANVDAHVTNAAVGAVGSGEYVLIMGTSTCTILLSPERRDVEGICGVVDGGVIPGLYAYEAGQNGVGDIYNWYVEQAAPPSAYASAEASGQSVHAWLTAEASKLQPGESGLLALDWWLGNRSTLVDTDLTGLMLGLSVATTPAEIYRALIEATAFGARAIVDAYEQAGVAIHTLIAAGGLPEKNALLAQIYADVIGKPLYLSGSAQAPALGSAIHAAVAAGLYPDIPSAARAMSQRQADPISPSPAAHAIYDELYADYVRLYDTFGRGANDVMKRIKRLRARQSSHPGQASASAE